MVASGLTSTTPYVVSATVTSISRLVFEFKGSLTSLPFLIHLTPIPI